MRYRQIHLDFHTSELIPGIGSRFDPEDFARTLQAARVDSINLFAKCHHGWSYHPTEVGKVHPHLDFDLLRAQMDACHAAGIETPIYVTAVWDELSAREHPEWLIETPNGEHPVQHGNGQGAGWKFLDLSSPYTDYLVRQIEEVVRLFPDGHGLWVDICFQKPSVSRFAKEGMERDGLDWRSAEDRARFAEATSMRFFERISAIAKREGKPIFFNLGHIRRGRPEVLRDFFSHLEIESLPTGKWGYDHFPVSARYAEPLGMEYLGMTGKFHHMWGEIGGYKLPGAMVYECGAMLAQGARCCIGDHLHPTGAIDHSTYAGIGEAYAWVEAREPWAEGSRNRAEIAVISTEGAARPLFSDIPSSENPVDDGVVRVLLEEKFTFDILDPEMDFSSYRLLILPDAILVDAGLKARIEDYLAKGGRLLLTGRSGIADGRLQFDCGAEWVGTSSFLAGDYALPRADLRADFVSDPLFMYAPSEQIRVTDGESLGEIFDPYFDRAGARFSGHLMTPAQPEPNGFAFGSRKGAVTYLAHPVFSAYHKAGAVAMLRVLGKVIEAALGGRRMIRTDMPTAGRATLRSQEGRDVLHLLYANPIRRGTLRGDAVQPIQDIVPLRDVAVEVEADGLASVRLVPEGQDLPFTAEGGRARFTVPRVEGHQMVELART